MQTEEKHDLGYGKIFQLTPKPEILSENAALTTFEFAKKNCQEFLTARQEILNDRSLSDIGKAEKMQPHIDGLQNLLGFHAETLVACEDHLARLDLELMNVPQPSNPYEISREKEIRSWWRELSDPQRLAVLSEFQDAPEKFTGIMNALKNSPLPVELRAHEAELVNATHRKVRRLQNPALANTMDENRISLEWAERGFAHLRGIVGRLPGFSRDETLKFHAERDNKERLVALGFTSTEIELAVRKAKAKKPRG